MLHHETRGDGPRRVMLLHGFLGSGRNLGSLARRWSERDPGVQIVLADLTGHGRSPPLPPDPTLEGLATDLVELARHLETSTLVGHSLGGRVALAARQMAPQLLRGVTLLDIAPGAVPTADIERILAALLAAPAEAAHRDIMASSLRARGIAEPLIGWLLLNLERRGRGVAWRIHRERLAQLHAHSGRLDLWSTLELGPTRCIRGGASSFVSDADARRMRAARCPVQTLAEAGHFLHMDAPDALLALLAHGAT